MFMKMSSVTFPLICYLFFFLEFVSSLDCSSNSHEADYEPFPRNVTPTEFHTRMEITLSHRNATYFVDERYDAEKERGAFTLLAQEYDWETYYDKSKDEIANLYLPVLEDEEEKLNLYLNACKSFTWTQERYDRYRCRFAQSESSLKLIADACSATVVLDLVYKNKTQNARYLGQKAVRNIAVKGWRICKNETALDYWFSVKGWSHTSGNASVPVLIEARPQSAVDLTGGIIHSYSFIDFFVNEPEFQVQKEIWCRGAIRPPPLPKLPRRFDVNLERVTAESTRVWSAQEYYDLDKHLYRKDSDGDPNQTTKTGAGIDIRDRTTMKSTFYNKETGKCNEQKLASTAPTLKFEEDNAVFDSPFGTIALFEDPDARPVYQGRGVARGIKCDVWRQLRINWPENAQANTIWRWFFTEKEGEESQLVPVRLEIEGEAAINSTDSVEIEFNLNFNSFESRYPTENAFDSSSICPQEPTTQKQKGLSSGGVAGVAIGCILLGLCFGCLVVYFWFKRRALARMGPPPMKFP
ncbi:uncharacterized protein LOC111330756 isoform X1 [Stylophora pistillata]|uniref:LolA-like domain-containing protein n=1 Tax=Stylophora pistillata TaxID=50429 RepID=A0A2B4S7U8_STYPI|nr:uncharacterized protein LOC111330756 isoform X1 [Stylophora pistillata]PFX25113.1 hypothetical protein AWC38_SpisGene10244 [Stylophora pistillata]